jgi:hypothetical protein
MSLKGWEGSIRVATTIANVEGSGSDEDHIQNVSPNFGNSLESIYELGSREPQLVKEGNIEISVDITAFYQSDTPTTWTTRCGVGAIGALTEYYLAIYPAKYSGGNPEIRCLGKFGDWSLDMSQDGMLMESMTFTGRVVAVGAAPIV